VAEDRAAYRAAVMHSVRTLEPLEHEYRIESRTGQQRWLHVRAVGRRDADGDFTWTGIMTDISVRKAVEASLRASEERFRTLFETVPQGIVYQDRSGAITAANPSAQRILGLTLDQMQGRTSMDPSWRALREDGTDLPGEEHPAMITLRTGEPVRSVMGVHTPAGSYVWILVNSVPLFRDGELEQVYASFEDITERVRLARELARQATTDFLTGTANRRSFMERTGAELERIRRHPEALAALAVIDIDHFKQVNDAYGHAAGDEVLKHLVRVVAATVRPTDLLGRTGGEEFALLLPDTGLDQAAQLAERIRATVAAEPLTTPGGPIPFTISIGLSVLAGDDASIDDAFARADLALYDAKNAGRDAVRLRPADRG
jgi:diguanylate cyclase (GGDEF)-like protein/PAS domain S-box-containing protein